MDESNKKDKINLLLDQLLNTTLLSERKMVIGEFSNFEKFEDFDENGIDVLLNTLKNDPRDIEYINSVLELLDSIVKDDTNQVVEYMIHKDRMQIFLHLLKDSNTFIRSPCVNVLYSLQLKFPLKLADTLLLCNEGLRILLQVLMDKRDHIRDIMLQMLITLTNGNPQVQQYLAFEDVFDIMFQIVNFEFGTKVTFDCITIIKHCFTKNALTQKMFMDSNASVKSIINALNAYYKHFLEHSKVEKTIENSTSNEVQDTTESTIVLILETMELLLLPLYDTEINDEMKIMEEEKRSRELPIIKSKLCAISILANIICDQHANLREKAMDVILLLIDGSMENQLELSNTLVHHNSTLALTALIQMEAKNEKAVKVTQLLDILCTQNEMARLSIIQHSYNTPPAMLDPDTNEEIEVVQPGVALITLIVEEVDQILRTMESNDEANQNCRKVWITTRRFRSILGEQNCAKELALKIPYDFQHSTSSNIEGGFFTRCIRALSQSVRCNDTRDVELPSYMILLQVSLFRLIMTWLKHCPKAVSLYLTSITNLNFLFDLMTAEKRSRRRSSFDGFRMNQGTLIQLQGFAASIVGLCLDVHNSSENALSTKELLEMIQHSVGLEVFTDCMTFIQQSTPFMKASKLPFTQLVLPPNLNGLLYDKAFTVMYIENSNLAKRALFQLYTSSNVHEDSSTEGYNELIRVQDSTIQKLQSEIESLKKRTKDSSTAQMEKQEQIIIQLEQKVMDQAANYQRLESEYIEARQKKDTIVSPPVENEIEVLRQMLQDAKCTQSISESAASEYELELEASRRKHEVLLAELDTLKMEKDELLNKHELLNQDELLNKGELLNKESPSFKKVILQEGALTITEDQTFENIPNYVLEEDVYHHVCELESQHRDLLLLLANQEIHYVACRDVLLEHDGQQVVDKAMQIAKQRGGFEL